MTAGLEARSLAELEEEREFLLASLEDLDREREAGDIEEADYAVLKDEYTARAAAVLRAIEAAGPSSAPAREAAPDGQNVEVPVRAPRRRLLAVALALAALVAVSVTLVVGSAEERRPGQQATGDIAETGPTGGVDRELARARQLTAEGQTLAAIRVYDGVLDRDPKQPEALAYRGWLVRLAGRQSGNAELVDKGLEYLNRAVAADPSYPDAHFFRGLVLYQDKGDAATAVTELQAFLDSSPPPEMVGPVQDVLRRAQADAAARAAGPGKPPAPQR